MTSKNHRGWDEDNIKERNPDKPSLQDDYSILGLADAIKDSDKAQVDQWIYKHFVILLFKKPTEPSGHPNTEERNQSVKSAINES